jgi:hypothetical protein
MFDISIDSIDYTLDHCFLVNSNSLYVAFIEAVIHPHFNYAVAVDSNKFLFNREESHFLG